MRLWPWGKKEPSPFPNNYLANAVWFNDVFAIPGRYRSIEGEDSSVVSASINWLARALEVVPLKAYTPNDREVENHPVIDLIRRPNNVHSYSNLLWSTIRSMIINGNVVYELLDRGTGIQVIAWQRLRVSYPRADSLERMPTYNVQTTGGLRHIAQDAVVHMIWEPDPQNAYLGMSPLAPVYGFLLLDKIAVEGAYGRLKSPIPGLLAKPGGKQPPTAQDKEDFKRQMAKLTEVNIGNVLAIQGDYEITELQGAIQKFDYGKIHNICEARISGQLGIPPSVSQMGVGLLQTRVGAVMTEESRLGWENGVRPLAAKIQTGFNHQLLPKLGYDPAAVELRFDFSELSFSTETEKTAKTDRIVKLYEAGIISLEEAQDAIEGLLQ